MFVKLALLCLLCSCKNYFAEKILIPKPVINQVKTDFKSIVSTIKDDGIYFDKENFANLTYNIKMSRIYYIQQEINTKMLQDYYIKVISDLGGQII